MGCGARTLLFGGRGDPEKFVLVTKHLARQANDFLGVAFEMADAVEDRGEDAGVVALHAARFEQLLGCRKTLDDACRAVDGLTKTFEQCRARNGISMRELGGAVAIRRRLFDRRDNPLPDIAAKMKDQVADRVHLRARPPPDLVVGKLIDAVFDALGGSAQCFVGLGDKAEVYIPIR